MKCHFVPGAFIALALACLTGRAALPVAPSNLQVSLQTPFTAAVSWKDNSTNETKFQIAYFDKTGGPFLAGEVAANVTNFTATGFFAPASTNRFFIRAYVDAVNIADSTNIQFVMPTPPNAPTNFTAVATGPTTIKLNWKDTSNNETNLLVAYRKIALGGGFTVFPNGSLAANTTNFIATNVPNNFYLPPATNLEPATTYEFFVRNTAATNSYSDSPTVAVTTQTLIAPQNLTATVSSPSSVTLRWVDGSTNEASFTVNHWQQNVSSSDRFGQPIFMPFPSGVTSSNVTNFTATGLVPGDTYRFRVQTIVDSSNVTNSGIVTVTLPGPSSRSFHPAVVGTSIVPYNITASTNAGIADLITASNLPPGLIFNAGVSLITGTPTQAGVYSTLLTAHYAAWGNVTRILTFRVIAPAGPPIVTGPIPTQSVNTNGSNVLLSLVGYFTDPDTEKAVRYVTTKGTMDVALYATATPETVSNFLNYVNRGDYNGSIVHRVPHDFVVQGGGYKTNGSGFVTIATDPSPTNEPGIKHVRGTIAMAKLGGLPSSATSEWFFNTFDSSAALDNQSGGFTAFGRILGSGISVVDDINNLPLGDYGSPFDTLPVDDSVAPPTIDFSKLVYVQSVTPIIPLTYSITANSMPDLITASISGDQLVISTTNHFGGTSILTITATDLEGNSVSTNVTVEINSPFTTWLNQFSLTGGDALPGANPDGDLFPNAVEFALHGSPSNSDAASIRPQTSFVTVSNQQYLALNFNMAKNLSGATVRITGTNNLSGTNWPNVWTSNDASTNQVVQKLDQTNFWKMTVRDSAPVTTNAPSRFLQLEVKLP